jgi:hypothetical protein
MVRNADRFPVTPGLVVTGIAGLLLLLLLLTNGSSVGGAILHHMLIEIAVIGAAVAAVMWWPRATTEDDFDVQIPNQPHITTSVSTDLDPVVAGMLGLESLIPRQLTKNEQDEVLTALDTAFNRLGQQAYLDGLPRDPLGHPVVLEAISGFPFVDARYRAVLSSFRRGYSSAQGGW